MNKTLEENGEREISSFTVGESIDYVINALNDGKYQDAYKTYLIHVLEHIRGSPVDENRGKMAKAQSGELITDLPYDFTEDITNSPDKVGYLVDGEVKTDKATIICERKLPWLKEPYRKVDGHYMPNIICLDEVTNRVLERYCEPRGSSEEASHEYTYNGTTIRWVKRECQ